MKGIIFNLLEEWTLSKLSSASWSRVTYLGGRHRASPPRCPPFVDQDDPPGPCWQCRARIPAAVARRRRGRWNPPSSILTSSLKITITHLRYR